MTKKPNLTLATILSLIALTATMQFAINPIDRAYAEPNPAPSEFTVNPVEEDVHEFMEYVNQPTYRRLKGSMAEITTDAPDWNAIKSDALILAEVGNLLLFRGQSSESKQWNEHAAMVRGFGKKLYRAADENDIQVSQQAYRSMLNTCNQCHQQFAGGSPQLQP